MGPRKVGLKLSGARGRAASGSRGRGFGLRKPVGPGGVFATSQPKEQPSTSGGPAASAAAGHLQASALALREAARARAAAVKQDANIFNYDEWKEGGAHTGSGRGVGNPAALGSSQAKPQASLVPRLLAAADRRKAEMEMSMERKRAREELDAEAAGLPTERFVTSAYREKLAEMEAAAKRDKQQEVEEALSSASALGQGAMEAFAAGMLSGHNLALGGKADAPPTARMSAPTLPYVGLESKPAFASEPTAASAEPLAHAADEQVTTNSASHRTTTAEDAPAPAEVAASAAPQRASEDALAAARARALARREARRAARNPP